MCAAVQLSLEILRVHEANSLAQNLEDCFPRNNSVLSHKEEIESVDLRWGLSSVLGRLVCTRERGTPGSFN